MIYCSNSKLSKTLDGQRLDLQFITDFTFEEQRFYAIAKFPDFLVNYIKIYDSTTFEEELLKGEDISFSDFYGNLLKFERYRIEVSVVGQKFDRIHAEEEISYKIFLCSSPSTFEYQRVLKEIELSKKPKPIKKKSKLKRTIYLDDDLV